MEIVTPGWLFPIFPYSEGNIIILSQNLLNTLHLVSKQSRPGQVNICGCISYSIYMYSNAHMRQVRIYFGPYAHNYNTINIFLNITHRQAISPVAKFYHLRGHGFLIQLLILIFMKWHISANRINFFTCKYNYHKLFHVPLKM